MGFALGLRGGAFASLVIVSLAKTGEAYAQTLYGYFQLNKRLDFAARSMILRAILGSVLFILGYAVSDDLTIACAGLLVGWQVTLWTYDIPTARRLSVGDVAGIIETSIPWRWATIRAISRKALPLGIDAGFRSLALSAPRFAISLALGSAVLGVYTALAALALIPTLITGSVGANAIPALAQFYVDGRRAGFLRLYGRVLIICAGVSIVFVAGCFLGGGKVVQLVLGPEYDDLGLLVTLALAYGAAIFQGALSQGLQAANKFSMIAVADGIALGLVVILSIPLIAHYGVVGAAAAFGLAMGASSILMGIAVGLVIKRMAADAGSDRSVAKS